MKTKIDISNYISKIVGPYDTIELMDNITDDDGNIVEGISIRVARRRKPNSLIYIGFYFPNEHNGVLLQGGNGGLASGLPNTVTARFTSEGYAFMNCNLGTSHGELSGYNNPTLWEDFGHVAIYETHRIGLELYSFIYGKSPEYTYYWSGSTGGQMGMSMLLRHPECFDGAIMGAPANNRVSLHTYFVWIHQKLREIGEYHRPLFNKADCEAIHRIAIEFHKARGRMLADAPDTIAFPVTEEHEIDEFLLEVAKALPLTDAQKQALYDVYQGPVNPNTGKRFYRGYPIGSEFEPFGLYNASTSEKALAHKFISLWALGHDFNPYTFDFGRDYEKSMELLSENLDASSPDITAFLSRGGKLLMLAGTNDCVVPYGGTVDYVKEVRATVPEEYLENFKFFVLPTRNHCVANGNTSIVTYHEEEGSLLDAMRDWVEHGKCPEMLFTHAITEEKAVITVPTFPA